MHRVITRHNIVEAIVAVGISGCGHRAISTDQSDSNTRINARSTAEIIDDKGCTANRGILKQTTIDIADHFAWRGGDITGMS